MMKSFYLTRNLFVCLGVCVLFFSFGMINEVFFVVGKVLFFLTWLVVLGETILLFDTKEIICVSRILPKKLSNGDENQVELEIKNFTKKSFIGYFVEELPEQLQIRKWERSFSLKSLEEKAINYLVFPKTRGEYEWGGTNVLLQLGSWSLVARRERFFFTQTVACFPSFEQFKKIPISAIVNNVQNSEKVVQRIGQSLEFEQIKEYSRGDDYRHLNWKASAKRGLMMVNQYQDERSQDIYCAIDLGRTMKMPFDGQTLLDYAINGTLALSKAIITMSDKAGLVGFSYDRCDYLPAKKDLKQFGKINDLLYNLETKFKESDFERLYKFARINIRQRSLLVIFTNFDSVNAMHRNLPYLKALSRYHLVLVVFFENSEVAQIVDNQAKDLKEIYDFTIGQSLILQNKLIAKELNKHGIKALHTKPENLSLGLINTYMDIKKKRLI
ncbi:DUF58 domain-containing protein [Lacihabitans soyangensis]|uniref:DUF58 domain-containing protein n=1 Tax=Lacihabitans soyangensis TaxID=869394 RepID=A0AAE3GZL4_9BACT|nr:DUF58 domain-containing protein [Lacihabitans soyangensis]MCP9762178.1 DUF58 domain-containing protein [Lacihabitans soyangensis]